MLPLLHLSQGRSTTLAMINRFFNVLALAILLSLMMPSMGHTQYTEVGLGLGQSVYWGDLNAPTFNTNLQNASLAGQLYLRYNHTPQLSFRAGLMLASLKGDDRNSPVEWQQERNLRFTNLVTELSFHAEYYLFGIDYNEGKVFSPYVTAGGVVFRHNPKTDFMGETVALQPLGTEGQGMAGFDPKYSLISAGISFGAGAKFALSQSLSVNIAILARRTFTDYIDDISTTYVNYNELLAGNGPLAASLGNRTAEALGLSEPLQLETGSKRGGSDVNDYYLTFMVSVNYYLKPTSRFSKGGKVSTTNCPTF